MESFTYEGFATAIYNKQHRLQVTMTCLNANGNNFENNQWHLVSVVKITKEQFENCGGFIP